MVQNSLSNESWSPTVKNQNIYDIPAATLHIRSLAT